MVIFSTEIEQNTTTIVLMPSQFLEMANGIAALAKGAAPRKEEG